jgi:hypothetical protein
MLKLKTTTTVQNHGLSNIKPMRNGGIPTFQSWVRKSGQVNKLF